MESDWVEVSKILKFISSGLEIIGTSQLNKTIAQTWSENEFKCFMWNLMKI